MDKKTITQVSPRIKTAFLSVAKVGDIGLMPGATYMACRDALLVERGFDLRKPIGAVISDDGITYTQDPDAVPCTGLVASCSCVGCLDVRNDAEVDRFVGGV